MDLIVRFLLLNQVFPIQVADDDDVYNQQLDLEQESRAINDEQHAQRPRPGPEVRGVNVLKACQLAP